MKKRQPTSQELAREFLRKQVIQALKVTVEYMCIEHPSPEQRKAFERAKFEARLAKRLSV